MSVAFRSEPARQLPGAPFCKGYQNITGIYQKYGEQIFKENIFVSV
jgi:hypothetical protein